MSSQTEFDIGEKVICKWRDGEDRKFSLFYFL